MGRSDVCCVPFQSHPGAGSLFLGIARCGVPGEVDLRLALLGGAKRQLGFRVLTRSVPVCQGRFGDANRISFARGQAPSPPALPRKSEKYLFRVLHKAIATVEVQSPLTGPTSGPTRPKRGGGSCGSFAGSRPERSRQVHSEPLAGGITRWYQSRIGAAHNLLIM